VKTATEGSGLVDRKEMEAMVRRAWQERGIVILWPDRIKDAQDRRHVMNIASGSYRKRERRRGSR
jgi:hypothetical protein